MVTAQQDFENTSTRPISNWPHRVLWLTAIVAPIPLIATLVYVPLPGEKVTARNFRTIRAGMSKSELREILGAPRYESVEMGLVSGPTKYTVNLEATDEELRSRGFKEYLRYVWISPEITITSIIDADEKVVCVYSGGGQPRDLRTMFGSTTTHHLPRHSNERLK